MPTENAGVCVECRISHPLVHAAIREARNAHDPATTRIQGAKLAKGAHAVTFLRAGSDGVGGKRHRCHGAKDEMHCSRHRDAVVRAEAAPIRSDEGVQIGLSCARPLDDLEHVGHAAAIGRSNGQGSPGVHGFDREMDHRPRCAPSPDARQNETDHERDDPHDQHCDRGTFTVWYQRSLHSSHGIGFPFNERRGRRTNDCGLLWPTSPASGALEEHSGRIHPGVDHDGVSSDGRVS